MSISPTGLAPPPSIPPKECLRNLHSGVSTQGGSKGHPDPCLHSLLRALPEPPVPAEATPPLEEDRSILLPTPTLLLVNTVSHDRLLLKCMRMP